MPKDIYPEPGTDPIDAPELQRKREVRLWIYLGIGAVIALPVLLCGGFYYVNKAKAAGAEPVPPRSQPAKRPCSRIPAWL